MAAGLLIDILAELAGDWVFDRSVLDGPSMTGTASFVARPDRSLLYAEAGALTMPDGKSFKFERRYVYERSVLGVRVLFDETPRRLFQDIALIESDGILEGRGFHDCPPDIYVSAYQFDFPKGFQIRHEVSGPRKAYTIETHYGRATMSRSEPSK